MSESPIQIAAIKGQAIDFVIFNSLLLSLFGKLAIILPTIASTTNIVIGIESISLFKILDKITV